MEPRRTRAKLGRALDWSPTELDALAEIDEDEAPISVMAWLRQRTSPQDPRLQILEATHVYDLTE